MRIMPSAVGYPEHLMGMTSIRGTVYLIPFSHWRLAKLRPGCQLLIKYTVPRITRGLLFGAYTHLEQLFDGGTPLRVGAEKRIVVDGVGGTLDIGFGEGMGGIGQAVVDDVLRGDARKLRPRHAKEAVDVRRVAGAGLQGAVDIGEAIGVRSAGLVGVVLKAKPLASRAGIVHPTLLAVRLPHPACIASRVLYSLSVV